MAYTDIDKPSDFFESKIWTGNGSSQNISLDFAPNFVWIKQRSATRYHNLQDTIRGVGLQLFSNTNGADNSDTANITAFNSDGYSLGSGDNVNKNSSTYVGWSWKAGTSFSNDASGTGIGSLDSTGTFNNTSGFSIVSYTGGGSNATVKHGLNTAPSMIIFKRRTGSGWNWTIYHKSIGNNYFVSLNTTNAKSNTSSSTYFQDTTPTSSVFSIGNSGHLNDAAIIAYCFAEKQGYSKFGSYTGNGNADGAFVYTGFKPAWVIVKRTDGTSRWRMYDNKINPFNVADTRLSSESSDAESTSALNAIDMISQGFKIRTSENQLNASGGSFIYMAFAENPFVTSTDNGSIPTTAR